MSATVPMTNVDVNIPPSASCPSEYRDAPQDRSNENHVNANHDNGNNHNHNDTNDGSNSNGVIVNDTHASSSQDAKEPSKDKHDDISEYSTTPGDNDQHHDAEDCESYGSNPNAAEEEVIKLFVGQVPKTMEEADLFPIFEQYGPMEDVAIIRDKHTGQHRGCAFVTFLSKESAEQCERELHGTFPFQGGKRPVQVRPAGKREENKVFVGMLPRNISEEMVTEVFESFGEISGVFVIKSTDGYRKGCAFVKFVHRDHALNAIAELNNKAVFQGSDRPIIVKIADSKPEKRLRMNNQQRVESPYSNGHVIGSPHVHAHGHNQAGFVRIPSAHGSLTGSVYSDTASESPQMNGHSGNLFFMPGHLNMPPPAHPHAHAHAHHIYTNQVNVHGIHHAHGHPSPPMDNAAEYGHMYHHDPSTLQAPFMDQVYQQHQHPSHNPNNTMRPPRHDHGHPQAQASNARPREGPAGANLFIYHLPHDLTDADLATAFNPFGNVLSAKVYVDKYTGESKGFGFVSYDSIISAEQAIELMNGFQIGNKRLKVQHKRVHHGHGQPQGGTPGFPMQNAFVQPVMGLPRDFASNSSYLYPNVNAIGQGVPGGQMMQGGGHVFGGDGTELYGGIMEAGHAHPGYHDVPVPSIEIESKDDDNSSVLRTIVSANSMTVEQNDIDALAQSLSGLNAGERDGNVQVS